MNNTNVIKSKLIVPNTKEIPYNIKATAFKNVCIALSEWIIFLIGYFHYNGNNCSVNIGISIIFISTLYLIYVLNIIILSVISPIMIYSYSYSMITKEQIRNVNVLFLIFMCVWRVILFMIYYNPLYCADIDIKFMMYYNNLSLAMCNLVHNTVTVFICPLYYQYFYCSRQCKNNIELNISLNR